jgi:hypothetical protein
MVRNDIRRDSATESSWLVFIVLIVLVSLQMIQSRSDQRIIQARYLRDVNEVRAMLADLQTDIRSR